MSRQFLSPGMSVLEYLVIRSLANNKKSLIALYNWIVMGNPPSVVEETTGVKETVFKGVYQRIITKALYDRQLASKILRIAIPLVVREDIVPSIVVDEEGGIPKCSVCGKLLKPQFPEDHIIKSHYSYVKEYMARVIRIIKSPQQYTQNAQTLETSAQTK